MILKKLVETDKKKSRKTLAETCKTLAEAGKTLARHWQATGRNWYIVNTVIETGT